MQFKNRQAFENRLIVLGVIGFQNIKDFYFCFYQFILKVVFSKLF